MPLKNLWEKESLGSYCQKVFLLLFGLCLAMVVMETFLRLFPSQLSKTRLLAAIYSSYRFESDPFLLRKLKPNLNFYCRSREFSYPFKTLTLGYQGIGFRDDGVDSECFAIAVGDSFTEGFINSENLWVELLERNTGLDFVNMGVGGTSPFHYTRILKKYGAPLRPKLVLWSFFQDDFPGTYNANRRLVEQTENKPMYLAIENWLLQRSYAFQVLQYIGEKMRKAKRGGYSSKCPYKDDRLSFVFDLSVVKQNMDKPEMQEGWKLTQESLLEAKTICQDIKANLVVILIPYKEQSYWHIVEGLIKDTQNCDVDQFNALMKDFCEEQGITYLDLTPIFREHAQKGEQLYYAEDGHWNREGNHLAAEAILAFLKEQGLLPQKNL